MDINQLVPILASRPPQERAEIAQRLGIDPAMLQQIEQAAVRGGLTLNGGATTQPGGGSSAAVDGSAEEVFSMGLVRGVVVH